MASHLESHCEKWIESRIPAAEVHQRHLPFLNEQALGAHLLKDSKKGISGKWNEELNR